MAKNKNKGAKGPWVAYTPEDTVIYSIRTYPDMYMDKFLVYNQLFCVIGNGYDWKKGRLESVSGVNIVPDIESSINAFKKSIKEDTDEQKKLGIELIRKSYTLSKASKPNFKRIDEFRSLKFRDEKFMFYPLSEYSSICCLPDDIKPAWLRAAREFYEILFENQDRVENPEWLPKIEVRILELEAKRRRLEERREAQQKLMLNFTIGRYEYRHFRHPKYPIFHLPEDNKAREEYRKEKERMRKADMGIGYFLIFKNQIKVSTKDISFFYGRRVNEFMCYLYKMDKDTSWYTFSIPTIDDGCCKATLINISTPTARSICREFIRTIPKKGIEIKSFKNFFEGIGADIYIEGWSED
jgi:hypothetical protein